MDSLGTIRLAIYRIKMEEDRKTSNSWRATKSVPKASGPVHERSKKGGAHCISYGDKPPAYMRIVYRVF